LSRRLPVAQGVGADSIGVLHWASPARTRATPPPRHPRGRPSSRAQSWPTRSWHRRPVGSLRTRRDGSGRPDRGA